MPGEVIDYPFEFVGPLAGAPPWVTRGMAERGQAEIAGPEHNERIRTYQTATRLGARADESPWCSDYVNWSFLPEVVGTRSAAAKSWLSWGEELDRFALGCVLVLFNPRMSRSSLTFSGYHVAFGIHEDERGWLALGGNQGNQVSIAHFARARWELRGRRWPKGWPR